VHTHQTIAANLTMVLASVLLLATLATAGQPQGDDAAWTEFLAWLRTAPAANGPLEVIQGFQKSLVAKGTPQAEAERRLNVVLRLMRERTDAWPLMFDRIYTSKTPSFSTTPNALLMAAVEGRTPGRALDIGMGQGRNAIGLARKGWTVTGFDVSAEGLAVAKAHAAQVGVNLTAILDSDQKFDYGTDQWDLIAVIYGPGSIADPAFVARLHRSLKPGGLVVVESFASDKSAARRRPVDIDPGDLLRASQRSGSCGSRMRTASRIGIRRPPAWLASSPRSAPDRRRTTRSRSRFNQRTEALPPCGRPAGLTARAARRARPSLSRLW
jgi:SAM-dependent methyltransferase